MSINYNELHFRLKRISGAHDGAHLFQVYHIQLKRELAAEALRSQ